ncbi:hypothetical protein [Mesorhizobium sp. WSM4982]|uniref:hypothetical protein n=1 Tax=Mesorhizobium sp. WSM4982 TaxID=3038550 RepID=UPI0024152C84|nr:hypothetical protein [Mesorhizobium sp. WSM4982]MDG4856438.1 hypothetical protein [Mesorhizobium sp. WSM4982]
MTIYDKVGQPLTVGSTVAIGCRGTGRGAHAVTGDVVSLGTNFIRIKMHEGTRTVSRKPWDVVAYRKAA